MRLALRCNLEVQHGIDESFGPLTAIQEAVVSRVLLAIACVTVLGGCGAEPANGPPVTVRDSAGIRIVESATPQWSSESAWVVSPEPQLEIGALDAEEPYQFFRIGDVLQLRDGRIVVANRGSQEVRYFSPDGTHLTSVGGEGEGPGEFRTLRRLFALPGDSILAFDRAKASLFDPSGQFVDSEPTSGTTPTARFENGDLLRFGFAANTDPYALGQSRPDFAVVRWRLDSSATDTIAIVPGGEVYRVERQGGIESYDAPFSREPMVAVRGDGIVTGDGSEFGVAVLDGSGALVSLFRRADIDREVTQTAIDWYEERRLSQATSEQQRQWRRIFSEWTYPERWPAFGRMMVDTEGSIWLESYPVGEALKIWTVLDQTGRWLGEIEMPPDLNVKQITRDAVLGTAVDELGVEFVRLHRLDRGN